MKKQSSGINLSRRKMLFQILRVVTSKLIKGQYQYPEVSEMTAEELSQRLNSSQPPVVIDTRSFEEFCSGFGHIPGSKHIPMMDLVMTFTSLQDFKRKVKFLEAQVDEIVPHREKEVVTICPGGGFSLVAAEIMADAGFKDVKSLSRGADGWFKAGYPTTKD
jgi:rhodanese-related sulfurtransferase